MYSRTTSIERPLAIDPRLLERLYWKVLPVVYPLEFTLTPLEELDGAAASVDLQQN